MDRNRRSIVRALGGIVLSGVLSAPALAAEPDDDASVIRHVMQSTWNRPDATVDVSPIVVVSDYAVAGWTQDTVGGRALLRKKDAAWVILLCAGDQLKQADTLRAVGIAADLAERLAGRLAAAERDVPPRRLAMFSRFEGLVSMDQHDAHAPHKH